MISTTLLSLESPFILFYCIPIIRANCFLLEDHKDSSNKDVHPSRDFFFLGKSSSSHRGNWWVESELISLS